MTDIPTPSITAVRDLREASCGPVGAPPITTDLSENVILTSLDVNDISNINFLLFIFGGYHTRAMHDDENLITIVRVPSSR